MADTQLETGFYIFGLAMADADQVPVLKGINGAVLEIVASFGKIRALGCRVGLDEFGQDEVAARLQDMDWVGKVATIHYAICDQLFRHFGSFLPFRLCTVYSGVPPLQEMLENEHKTIVPEFTHLESKAEFGLKIWGRAAWLENLILARSPDLQKIKAEIEVGGGKAFFAQKRFDLELAISKKRQIPQLSQRLAAMMSSALSIESVDYRLLDLPSIPKEGHVAIANLALLLRIDRQAELQNLAERIDKELLAGGLIEVIGPMPPYSFIRLGREE